MIRAEWMDDLFDSLYEINEKATEDDEAKLMHMVLNGIANVVKFEEGVK